MTHKISLFLATGVALLLAPLSTSLAQRSAVRGYRGAAYANNHHFYGRQGNGGYYGGRHRYYYRGSYFYYDPFLFGGFGYPYYYGGFGPGVGVGYEGYGGGGYGAEPVYRGRIVSDGDNKDRRAGNDDEIEDERDGGRGGHTTLNSMTRAVQSELKVRGYYRGSVDGQFGSGTAEALRKFQREKGLKVTGRLDERTLKALGFDER